MKKTRKIKIKNKKSVINTIDKKTRKQIYRIIKTHKNVLDRLS